MISARSIRFLKGDARGILCQLIVFKSSLVFEQARHCKIISARVNKYVRNYCKNRSSKPRYQPLKCGLFDSKHFSEKITLTATFTHYEQHEEIVLFSLLSSFTTPCVPISQNKLINRGPDSAKLVMSNVCHLHQCSYSTLFYESIQ